MLGNNERESCETFFNVANICQKLHSAVVEEGCLLDDDDDDDDGDHHHGHHGHLSHHGHHAHHGHYGYYHGHHHDIAGV